MYVCSHRPRLALPVLLSVQALLVAVLLAGCGRSGQALEVYSGRGENLVGPLLDQFTEDSGIAVKVRYGDSADLALLIAEEGRRTPADVFFSQSPGAVGFLSEGGLLAPLDQDLLDRVDPRFRNSGGRWVAVSGRQRVLVYNRDRVKEADLPESVFDLTGASYAGKVAVAPQNASFQDFITAMRQIKGDEATLSWLTAMARNRSPTYASNNAIVSAVARGEVPFGLVNHYYNFRFLAEDPSAPTLNHAFSGGDVGGIVIVSSVAIPEPSGDKARARRLVEFLLSKKAQQYFRERTFEYPIAAGLEPDPRLPSLSSLEVLSYDFEGLGGGLKRTTELIARSGLQR